MLLPVKWNAMLKMFLSCKYFPHGHLTSNHNVLLRDVCSSCPEILKERLNFIFPMQKKKDKRSNNICQLDAFYSLVLACHSKHRLLC